jgi:hypothetical protein
LQLFTIENNGFHWLICGDVPHTTHKHNKSHQQVEGLLWYSLPRRFTGSTRRLQGTTNIDSISRLANSATCTQTSGLPRGTPVATCHTHHISTTNHSSKWRGSLSARSTRHAHNTTDPNLSPSGFTLFHRSACLSCSPTDQ